MGNFILGLILLVTSFSSLARPDLNRKSFEYTGQAYETVNLENTLMEERMRDDVVPHTCTRSVNYMERVCRNVPTTRRVCNDVRRTVQECKVVPARQHCVMKPVQRRVCRPGPMRRVCKVVPAKKVCKREMVKKCRRNRRGKKVCVRVPKRVCKRVPARKVCRKVPGPQSCRVVRERRRVCNTIPARRVCRPVTRTQRVCRDVPHMNRVCRDVPRTRQENYACTRTVRVPFNYVLRRFLGKANIEFKQRPNLTPRANFKMMMTREGHMELFAKNLSPRPTLIVAKRRGFNEVLQGNVSRISSNYVVRFFDQERLLSPINSRVRNVNLKRDSLSFSTGLIHNPRRLGVTVVVEHRGEVLLNQSFLPLALQITSNERRSRVSIDLRGLEFRPRELMRYKVTVTLSVDVRGEVLNRVVPAFTRTKTVTDLAY